MNPGDGDEQDMQQIAAAAEAWFEKELARAAKAHGDRWPEHAEWVTAYLREELRERLRERGWKK